MKVIGAAMSMKNKQLQAKLLHHIKLMQPDMEKRNVYEIQLQVSKIRDIIEIILTDPETGTVQQGPAQNAPRANGPVREITLLAQGPMQGGPAFENSADGDPMANDAVQTFMTARGTRVIPPSWCGVPAYTLPPGAAIPVFERPNASRGPATQPSGVAQLLGNAVPTHRAVDSQITQEQQTHTVGSPGGAPSEVFITPNATMGSDQPAGAGARNITTENFPGGQSIEAGR